MPTICSQVSANNRENENQQDPRMPSGERHALSRVMEGDGGGAAVVPPPSLTRKTITEEQRRVVRHGIG